MSEHQDTTPVAYRDVPEFPGYRVGDDGTLWSRWKSVGKPKLTDAWKQIRGFKTKGYYYVELHRNGETHRKLLSRLILEVFVGPSPEPTSQCRHFPDRDTTNNHLSNLRWGTPRQNAADRVPQGTMIRGSDIVQSKLTEADIPVIRQLLAEGIKSRFIEERFGVSKSMLNNIANGKAWSHVEEGKEFARVPFFAIGDSSHLAKLRATEIPEIRRLASLGMTQEAIASRFGVTPPTISKIIRRRNWKHVPG